MGKCIDITGQQFGYLSVIERVGSDKSKRATWRCRCKCGNDGVRLRNGTVQSCGCLQIERVIAAVQTHGKRRTRIYRIWCAIKSRCNNPKTINYKYYGGRGIHVCKEWIYDFEAFYDWAMSHGYEDDLSIDRIDNDKGYSPDNCRWVTMKEQIINRRPRKRTEQ